MHRGCVDCERTAAAARRQLRHVLIGQIQRPRLVTTEGARHLERSGTLLCGPDTLRVADVPDHHPTRHFDHSVPRQIVVVDPLLNVGEGTQDGIFRIPDQGRQLLIRDRDGTGAEPPVTHIMWCRPCHDSAPPLSCYWPWQRAPWYWAGDTYPSGPRSPCRRTS